MESKPREWGNSIHLIADYFNITTAPLFLRISCVCE